MYNFGVTWNRFSDIRHPQHRKLTLETPKTMQNFKVNPHQGLIATDLARKTIVQPVIFEVCFFFFFKTKNFVLLRLPPRTQEETSRHGNRSSLVDWQAKLTAISFKIFRSNSNQGSIVVFSLFAMVWQNKRPPITSPRLIKHKPCPVFSVIILCFLE